MIAFASQFQPRRPVIWDDVPELPPETRDALYAAVDAACEQLWASCPKISTSWSPDDIWGKCPHGVWYAHKVGHCPCPECVRDRGYWSTVG